MIITTCIRAPILTGRRADADRTPTGRPAGGPTLLPPSLPSGPFVLSTSATSAPASLNWTDPARQALFTAWISSLSTRHALDLSQLRLASADASFRRYLRLPAGAGTAIVMDAPPPLEDVRPFVRVAALIQAAGLNVPRVLAADVTNGFLLLTDLGDQLYLHALTEGTPAQADQLMRQASAALVRFQSQVPGEQLPPFGPALLQAELDLFPTWCVQREFGLSWSAAQHSSWQALCDLLIQSAVAQPQLAVHADWMPRNLMVCEAAADTAHAARGGLGPQATCGPTLASPGILDFQDAVCGPITYDMASLLRDAFISWPEEQELDWAVRAWQAARAAALPVDADFGEHWRQLEWMGLQRHLKVMGIFCRLKHRDGKDRYATDLPRFMAYATKVAKRYRPLQPLLRLLEPLSGARVQDGHTF